MEFDTAESLHAAYRAVATLADEIAGDFSESQSTFYAGETGTSGK